MKLESIASEIVENGARVGVEGAGAAAFGPLWPVLKPVLKPIIEGHLARPEKKVDQLLKEFEAEDAKNREQAELVGKLVAALDERDLVMLRAQAVHALTPVCLCAVELWEQVMVLVAASQSAEVDPYMAPSVVANARRLHSLLGQSRLYGFDIAGESGQYHDWQLSVVFRQSLEWLASLPPEQLIRDRAYERQHFLFGLVRLVDMMLVATVPPLDRASFIERVAPKVQKLREPARTYLREGAS